jgi:glycosyltransferase involved in cell wall biosynthesis
VRVLIVSPYLPHAQVGHGGGISSYHFARELARRHEVELLCFARHGEAAAAADLGSAGVRLTTIRLRSPRDPAAARPWLLLDRGVTALAALTRREPPMVGKYRRRAMRRALLRAVERFDPDVVQFEFSLLAPDATALLRWRGRRGRPIVVLNTHEAALLPRRRRQAAARGVARLRGRLDLALWTAHERRLAQAADLLQCVSEQDRQLYLELGLPADRLWHQPLGVDAKSLPVAAPASASAQRLLFVGSFDHAPNREAAHCLRHEIFPALLARHPALHLDIVGARPPASLSRPADGRVRVHGFVGDLDHIFDGASCFVAPLFSGGGIKIKVLEAMARGTAVVTTPIGIEGIEATPQVEFLLAADLRALVEAVDRLLRDPARAEAIGRQARARILARYGWPRLVGDFERRIGDFTAAMPGR